MAVAKKKNEKKMVIAPIKRSVLEIFLISVTELVMESMTAHSKGELLYPKPKTTGNKHETMKHDPMQEYRNSAYRTTDETAKARLFMPCAAWKGAIRDTASDLPDVAKTELGRWLTVLGKESPVWGVPQMFMSMVKQKGFNGSPDVRTRAILPEWATKISIQFPTAKLTEESLINIVAAAGVFNGMGGFRVQKGRGSFGQFRIVGPDDKDWNRIVRGGGMKAQDAALLKPKMFDKDTEELWTWFKGEAKRRGDKITL